MKLHLEAGYGVAAAPVLEVQLLRVGEHFVLDLVGQRMLDGELGVKLDVQGGRLVCYRGVSQIRAGELDGADLDVNSIEFQQTVQRDFQQSI